MMTLITGQPGAGKSLHAIWLVKQYAEKEGRPVFYTGIADLTLDWTEMQDPMEWHKLPVGSIIVFDEVQRQYRPRPAGAAVPESVEKFETHRHSGYDIFLITQHPMLLDSNIRRLCGRHIHVMRAFGGNAANIHEWNEVRENCDKQRLGSQSKLWKYPKEVFGYYKSAEMHTHKFRPPLRILMLIVAPFLLGGVIWFLVSWQASFASKVTGQPEKKTAGETSSLLPGRPGQAHGHQSPARSVSPLDQYAPTVPGLLFTAPRYESVTDPARAPYPVGCFLVGARCNCVTDQSTRLDVPPEMCKALVETGFYRDWNENGGGGRRHAKEVH
ncbi:zonular occludens toxin domain-containing protein [Dechloromonas sp. ZY10]|uniref:zonular occludens toxin domain-containing protein n=1 Tax=Dechloromonas aquae TaxID=2664436 RepID=UPI0035294942